MKAYITITDENGNTYEGTANLVQVTGKSELGAKPQPKPIQKPKPAGATEAVYQLYLEGFFKDEKSFTDVETKLSQTGFNFSKSSIFTALEDADYLLKKGTKRHYTFIQKYPPS